MSATSETDPVAAPAIRRSAAAALWIRRLVARHAGLIAMPVLLVALLVLTVVIHPRFGSFDSQSIAMAALPLAFAAAGQTVVVISGGIDLSIGSVIAVSNVLAARMMQNASFEEALLLAVLIMLTGAAVGAINGLLVVLSRVPDVVVTLTTGFIWGGVALLILEKPGGGAPEGFLELGIGTTFSPWISNSLILLIVALAIIWIPVRSTKLGLFLYAVGSDRVAAFRSGVNVEGTRVASYVLSGLLSSIGGIGLIMTTGIGSPLAGIYYTLSGLAAVVLGGVSLAGGRGAMAGPVIAAFALTLLPADLIFMNIDPNYGQVIQGTLIVLVAMMGGFLTLVRKRK